MDEPHYDCAVCEDVALNGDPRGFFRRRMILCPTCGNKRCPKASAHWLACTGSNDSGQIGSFYGPHESWPQPGEGQEKKR